MQDLRSLLSQTDPSKRVRALMTLPTRRRRPSPSAYRLVAALATSDPDRVVRIMCCHTMKWAPSAIALPALLGVLRNPSELASVRQEAMEALAYHPRERVPEAVVAAGLRDPSPQVRFFAAYTAGELRFSSTRPALRALLENDRASTPFGRVRTAARRALGQLG
ncbi:MAG: HEAT repeat domain-containing protein [Myxococcales bacterium]|nr:HEAT repeat domain-containing protein [Myxococcales bacterium]